MSAMIDFPTIDELTRRLCELGALPPERWEEFKRLELTALASERSEDALMLFGRLGPEDPAKQAMQQGLDDLRLWAAQRVRAAPSKESPLLCLVSGAPGSGKSAMMERIALREPDAILATADDFKARFKEGLEARLGDTPEPARSNLGRSVYIHRLTSLPSWEMVDQAIDEKKDLAVEMLGMGAAEDARTVKRAIAKGYRVEIYHIGCSVEQSLARAAKRHFDQKERGEEGRWVGLTAAAGRQLGLLSAFCALKELLAGSGAKLTLVDNTRFEMEPIWTSDETGAPPIDRFASWKTNPDLWREGVNPAADLCALSKDEQGNWRVALVERGAEPFKGFRAFPGGFIKGLAAEGPFEWGHEVARDAALRRFKEETLSEAEPLRVVELGKFDAMERDPRNTPGRWVESWVFAAELDGCPRLAGGDAARSASWVLVSEALSGETPMAFDHAQLLARALAALDSTVADKLRGKRESDRAKRPGVKTPRR